MKKLLVLVSLALVLGLVIGCPNDTPTPEPTPEPTLDPSVVVSPSFTPADGSIVENGDVVTLASTTDGASVYYTNGTSDFSVDNWTLYKEDAKPTVDFGSETSVTYKAIAVKDGMTNSSVVSAGYKKYVAVTGINVEIATAIVGIEKSLTATVEPSTATNKDIVWSVKSGTATITDGKLTATEAGEVEITATITNGIAVGTDYTKIFTIAVISPITMISIPQGEYEYQGTDGGDEELKENKNVAAFSLGETEVTQKQWEDVMGETWPGGDPETDWKDYGDGDNYPAYYVSWYDAIKFCNQLSIVEGLNPVYYTGESYPETPNITKETKLQAEGSESFTSPEVKADYKKNGYRLPTEVEWEYAAGHGGFESDGTTPKARNIYAAPITKDDEPNGIDDTDLTIKLEDYAVYGGSSAGITSSAIVKEGRKANALELYDLSGNVWEWCYDLYRGSYRVYCGGPWGGNVSNCRVDSRSSYYPIHRNYNIGFRVARSAVSP